MRIALEEAQAAGAAGEVPVGAAILDPATGEVLARAANGPVLRISIARPYPMIAESRRPEA